jgi:hypothetical protein
MGFNYKGVCYADIEQASSSFCESLASTSILADGRIVNVSCAGFNTEDGIANALIQRTVPNTSIQENYYETFWLPYNEPCDFTGGASLSLDYFYLAMGVLVLIWCAKKIINIFTGKHEVI